MRGVGGVAPVLALCRPGRGIEAPDLGGVLDAAHHVEDRIDAGRGAAQRALAGTGVGTRPIGAARGVPVAAAVAQRGVGRAVGAGVALAEQAGQEGRCEGDQRACDLADTGDQGNRTPDHAADAAKCLTGALRIEQLVGAHADAAQRTEPLADADAAEAADAGSRSAGARVPASQQCADIGIAAGRRRGRKHRCDGLLQPVADTAEAVAEEAQAAGHAAADAAAEARSSGAAVAEVARRGGRHQAGGTQQLDAHADHRPDRRQGQQLSCGTPRGLDEELAELLHGEAAVLQDLLPHVGRCRLD